ncbi:MATE family efflux transporter [Alteromonas flava]|uniref:MATE family efflux transporter n=1 Tax=Alteromonas flava TaxID=2048003 RepID=UPI0023E87DAA|nr:MATE family efflux transporter [Alteromonas flava]
MAWPLLIAQLTQMLMGVADTMMAGRYSANDMAAVAIGFSITTPILMFIQGIALSIPPIISRLNGAGETDKIANATQQAIWSVLSISLLVYVLLVFIEPLLALVPMADELRVITIEYVTFVLWSAPAFALYQGARNFCEGLNQTRPTMLITLLGLMINIPANYVFIYGGFGLPAMGGAGCGLATALVFGMMMIATLLYANNSRTLRHIYLFRQLVKPNISEMIACIKIGLPIAMTILFEVTLFSVVALLLAPFGAITVAAHQIALNFSSLMFMFPLSIGMAVSIRIAYLIGHRQPNNARLALKSALILGLTIAIFTASLTVLLRYFIPTLYTQELSVINYAAPLLLLAALFQFSDAIQAISANALRGYKDTTAMFLITFTAYWLIGLPMGLVLALTDWIVEPLQARGFWMGFIIGLSCAAIMLGYRVSIIQRRIQQQL